MYSGSAELYDQIYFAFKDYQAEVSKIKSIIDTEHPKGRTLLDVACGTGEHARLLHDQYGFAVDGIDISPDFVSLARQKNPDGQFYEADMVNFQLNVNYDVILCLFSSIGYVKSQDRVTMTLRRFRSHLKDDGLIILEPWFPPGVLTPGKIHTDVSENKALTVARMGYCEVEGRISTLHFEYLVGRNGAIEHLSEVHQLGLFAMEEMDQCFNEAGLTVVFEETGISGRGVYIAEKSKG